MNLYLFIVQIFIYVNTIIQIVVIIFEAIYLLLNRLSFRWSMHLDYFWLTREIEETKTKIEKKLQIGKKIDAEQKILDLSLIHISEPTRRTPISYAVFCLKKKKNKKEKNKKKK